MKEYYQYWGKAKKAENDNGAESGYHLLIYHLLDVAAIGQVLLSNHTSFLRTAIQKSGMTEKSFLKWFLLFLSLHDVGKFSTSFQNIRPDLLLKRQERTSNKIYDSKNNRHDQLGWYIFDAQLKGSMLSIITEDILKKDIRKITSWFVTFARIAAGHHGIPPENVDCLINKYFTQKDCDAVSEWFEDVSSFFLDKPLINETIKLWSGGKEQLKVFLHFSWQLAGFTVICDWIGSGDSFKYYSDSMPISDYWQISLKQAEEAVRLSGILPAKVYIQGGMKRLFPEYANTPTPLQKFCNETVLPHSQQLWILEDVTGAGKTEAALTLASRIISAGMAEGCFIALPTMATSNAMYDRMAGKYFRLYQNGEKPSLVLSHGSRHLLKKFRDSYRDNIISTDKVTDVETGNESEVHCAQWLADSRKKALLADTGVGTIDQLLLGILPGRYQSLRHYGMCRKVLIVDEVHSYDPYMLRLLESVLEGHAVTGGSAILLSATLPKMIRQRFISSYRKGLGEKNEIELNHSGYPLITAVFKNDSLIEKEVDTRPSLKRTVSVEFYKSSDDIYLLINKMARKNKCVCWIRNTIGDVMEAYRTLLDSCVIENDKIDIFHSRFALYDRLEKEKQILERFGNNSGEQERKGRILIASQVVEQSLDLDFDVLISDLAPIDLLVQRAGRLHRHLRDRAGNRLGGLTQSDREPPVFYVNIPPEPEKPVKNWYSEYLKGASYVYPDTALLWRTKEILKRERAINMPEKARDLIEGVYGEEAIEIPDVFYDSENEAWGKVMAKQDMADFNLINLGKGYNRSSSNRWDEEERIPTRLGENQVTVYLCRIVDADIKPLYEGEFPWDISSLQIREGVIGQIKYKDALQKQIEELKKSRLIAPGAIVLAFEDNKLILQGTDQMGRDIEISYKKEMGILIE